MRRLCQSPHLELAMVNQHQLNDLENSLKKLIDAERTRAELKEQELQQQISDLVLENSDLKSALSKHSHTILLDTIKAWIDGISSSITIINKEIGQLTYRLNKEEEILKEERKTSTNDLSDLEKMQQEIKKLRDGQKFINSEMGLLKLKAGFTNTDDEIMDRRPNDDRGFLTTSPNLGKLQRDVNQLGKDMDYALDKLDTLEDHSRRNNIIFYGINEIKTGTETWEHSEALVRKFLKENLKLESDSIGISRAHRLKVKKGEKDDDKPRPIIAKFESFKSRQMVLKASKLLRDTEFSLSEDFCAKTIEIRKSLVPKMMQARNEKKFATINYRSLVVKPFKSKPDSSEAY